MSGYKFKFVKIPIGYGRGRGYNWVPVFTEEELNKFIETSKLIKGNGIDKAIKTVWGDIDTELEQRREETSELLFRSLGQLRRFCCKVFQKIYFSVKLRKKTERTE